MYPLTRFLVRASLVLGFTLLSLGSGDLKVEAIRGSSTTDWTRQPPGRRADNPAGLNVGATAAIKQRISDTYGRLPISFEKNEGQTDARVEFVSRGLGRALFLSNGGEAVLTLSGTVGAGRGALNAGGPRGGARRASLQNIVADGSASRDSGAVLRLKPAGARRNARAEGRDKLPGAVNYLRGKDRSRWRTGISTYARVAYENIYPGVDLVYYGNQRQLEYDFIVRPGADPRVIALEAEGADRLEVDERGDLVLHVGNRQVRQQKPVVYQEVEGVRQELDGRYALQASNRVTFQLGAYDPTLPLVIDPVLVYSTYLGGASNASDFAADVAVDAAGQAYVTGYTFSSDFSTTPGAYDRSHNGQAADVFVTKLDAAGSVMLYSTFLGGASDDIAHGIAVDAAGEAYVTGLTASGDFPVTTDAFDSSHNGGVDVFVTKLDTAGSALVYSTFLGGANEDAGQGIAVDEAGAAYVTGYTYSSDFPATTGTNHATEDFADAFVTKLDAAGARLVYSTVLGGADDDSGQSIAVDAAGHAYVVGYSSSSDFPTTPLAYNTTLSGGADAFVMKLEAGGATLAYSTFLGGTGDDIGQGIAVDVSGEVYVTGSTSSSDFPTKAAYDPSFNGGFDVFVTKLHADGATLAYSTFLGGLKDDMGQGVAVNADGEAYVTGYTTSSDFPTAGAYDASFNGSADAFAMKLDGSGLRLLYSTFLGGGNGDFGLGIALDGAGHAYVTGFTTSFDFPTTAFVYDPSFQALTEAFVTKIGDAAPPVTVTLTPTGTANTVGQQVCTTATVRDASGNPLRDLTVRFVVTGANAASGSAVTDENGEARFCYVGTHAGLDAIRAFADTDNDGTEDANEPAAVVESSYLPGAPAALILRPAAATAIAGASLCVTATVRDSFGNPTPQVTSRFSVTGANTISGPAVTDANGEARFCYAGTHAGIDTIKALADTDNDGIEDANEPKGMGQRTYLPGAPASLLLTPPAGSDIVDARHCVTATVRDSFGNPTPNVTVRFTVTGAVTTSGAALTNAAGEAGFCYTGSALPGTDAIGAYADTDNDNSRDVGEPSGAAAETWVLPPASPGCADVDGIGYFTVAGHSAGFAFDIDKNSPGATLDGELGYLEWGRKLFVATAIKRLIVTGNSATIHGTGNEYGSATVPFRVDVTAHPDTFKIAWPGYAAGGSVTGDIVIVTTCGHNVHDYDGNPHHHEGGYYNH